ncbi:hypothetical protein Rhe02_57990 [Rhizocola hellebori]|uniref:Uncharacterized protein n=1 Tax=Rhizocola hellebori TaxID=1392758 RepID=A0A8J3QDP5_9ACTN|nr:hypothetical protein [Rhizocola hellebori]GIH07732.1 hypothetical protein Rhe02_57990 [Rhizocola hellebori]
MIPQIATVRVQSRPDRHLRLWIPLLPIYLILTPVLFLIIIGGAVACARYRINPIRALTAGAQMLAGLGGLHIDIKAHHSNIMIKLA